MYIFNQNNLTWRDLKVNGNISLLHRAFHSTCVVDNSLYIIGGLCPENILPKERCEINKIHQMKFNYSNEIILDASVNLLIFESIDIPSKIYLSCHGTVVFENEIYIYRGYQNDYKDITAERCAPSNYIHKINPNSLKNGSSVNSMSERSVGNTLLFINDTLVIMGGSERLFGFIQTN